VIFGVPAALIGLRNAPSREHAPPAKVVYERPAQRGASQPETAQVAPTVAPAPLNGRKYRGDDLGLVANDEPVAQASQKASAEARPAAPSPAVPAAPIAVAAPAPPPPPPPPPTAVGRTADSSEAIANDVVVTGSRVANPALSREQGFAAKARRSANRDVAAAVDPAYAGFLSDLQAAVRADDRVSLIALVGFPLRVNAAGRSRVYRDAQAVERDFERIFTARVRRAILKQRPEGLLVRDQGAMVGKGELWFDHRCSDPACSAVGPLRITAVNP
jgi:hypothetical protein